MTDHDVTYGHIYNLLLGLQFVEEPVREHWKAYRHGQTDTLILLVRHKPSLRARETDVVSVRRHLVDNGLIEENEFEDFLAQGHG
jgi:hypothetical protein